MTRSVQPFCLLIALLASATAWSQPAPPDRSTQWIYRAWQTDDGLPNNDVNAVVQDAEGCMLFATNGGLVRFDGLRLVEEPPDPAIKTGQAVTGIVAGRDGTRWAVAQGKLLVTHPDGGRNEFELPGIAGSARLTAMFEAEPGVLWMGFELGPLLRFKEKTLERVAVEEAIPRSFSTQITRDAAGGIWAAGPKVLAKWRHDRFEKVLELPDARARICASREGGLWIGSEQKLLRYTERDGIIYEAALPGSPAGTRVSMLMENAQGHLWFGTYGDGLHIWNGRSFDKVPLSNHDVWWLSSDHENNLWVSTGGGGVCRVRGRVLSMLDDVGAPVQQTARALCMDARGDVWTVLQTGELYAQRNGDWQHLAGLRDWPYASATCLVADREGGVWVASNDGGMAHWDGETFKPVALPVKKTGTRVRAMLISRDGSLWFNRGEALVHGKPGNWVTLSPPSGTSEIQALVQDSAGRIWAGNQDGQVYRVEKDRIEEITLPGLEDSGPVRTMLATPDGAVWGGTSRGGLARFKDGRVARVTTAHGLGNDVVSQLLLDRQGRVWGAGARGIFVTPLNALNAVADGRATVLRLSTYGREEGVPSIQANSGYTPNALASKDGRMWFATRSGIVIADPSLPGTNQAPPPVGITGMRIDGRPARITRPLKIPPGVTTLRFELAAMSYVSPESVIVQHQLTEVDHGWTTSGLDRTAVYGNLAPGSYTLRVRAANNDGLWSRREAQLRFTVLPFFWQTTWFLASMGAFCFAATAFTTYRISAVKAHRHAEQLRREAEVHRERTRIARDMHDQIGASLTRIMLLADLAQMESGAGAQHADLAATARQAVTDLDEIVWAVNPKHDRLASLLEYISQQSADLLQTAGIRCRLDMPPVVPDRHLSAEFRHHLFLIVREAVNNAVKYSGASEVRLQVTPEEGGLRIVIADNGTGITNEPPQDHSDGLSNMKSRAGSLGGTLTIESSPVSGTTVSVYLPWPPIHANI